MGSQLLPLQLSLSAIQMWMFDTEGARQKFELTNRIVQVKFYVQIDSSKILFHKECRAFQSKY